MRSQNQAPTGQMGNMSQMGGQPQMVQQQLMNQMQLSASQQSTMSMQNAATMNGQFSACQTQQINTTAMLHQQNGGALGQQQSNVVNSNDFNLEFLENTFEAQDLLNSIGDDTFLDNFP